jgi:hypothetical protein
MAVVQESIPLRLKINTLEKSYDGETTGGRFLSSVPGCKQLMNNVDAVQCRAIALSEKFQITK